MEYPWNWDWMTPGECADYWNDSMRRKTDEDLKDVDPNSTVGFLIYWRAYCENDIAEMFVIDPLRLGRGCGEAATSGSWLHAGLGVVTDFGRAAAFLPLGKLVKAVPKRFPVGAAPHAPIPKPPTAGVGKLGAPATASRGQAAAASMYRNLFYFADPASKKGICAFVGLTQALRHTGRIFTKIEHIADLVGVKRCGDFFTELAGKAPFTTTEVAAWLDKLGVPYVAKQISSIDNLLEYAANAKENGVYVFIVQWTQRLEGGVTKQVAHLMYVGRTASGEVRIFDRSGRADRNLYELETLAGYKDLSFAYLFGNKGAPLFIPNAQLIEETVNGIKLAGATLGGGLITIAIPVKVATFMTGNANGQRGRR